MGVNVRVLFDYKVRLDDIAKAMSILAGNKPFDQEYHNKWREGTYKKVNGYKLEAADHSPCYCNILLEAVDIPAFIDGEKVHWAFLAGNKPFFAFEDGIRDGNDFNQYSIYGKGFSVPSTAFWIAMTKRLVDFFGGYIDYQDGDDSDIDYMQPLNVLVNACNGEPWEQFQNDLFSLKPISQAEYKEADKVAAYTIAEKEESERRWKERQEMKAKEAKKKVRAEASAAKKAEKEAQEKNNES